MRHVCASACLRAAYAPPRLRAGSLPCARLVDAPERLIVEEDGQKVFRFVKAIPTAQPCLNCHGGDDVKVEVVEKLAELYPEDTARGFSVDQMRGVFTLSKTLSE